MKLASSLNELKHKMKIFMQLEKLKDFRNSMRVNAFEKKKSTKDKHKTMHEKPQEHH